MLSVNVLKVEWSPTFGNNIVVLKERGGARSFSILVDDGQARIIETLLETRSLEPYKRSDLLPEIFKHLGCKVLRVEIQKDSSGEVVADVVVGQRGKIHKLRRSPAEAIELALRCDCSIVLSESLAKRTSTVEHRQGGSQVEQLRQALEKAIASENYEEAAKLRDRISKLQRKRK